MKWIRIAKRMTKINGAALKIDEMTKIQMIVHVKVRTKKFKQHFEREHRVCTGHTPHLSGAECDKMHS